MSKPQHDPKKWKTAGDVVDTAKVGGANVTDDGEWISISTPQGKMKITPNARQELDSQTLSNARRWFRLLGLMVLIGFLLWYFWPTLQHFGIV